MTEFGSYRKLFLHPGLILMICPARNILSVRGEYQKYNSGIDFLIPLAYISGIGNRIRTCRTIVVFQVNDARTSRTLNLWCSPLVINYPATKIRRGFSCLPQIT